jgi:ElaB/YqjD/DUF883 family membrane-anchored ribosome-binding protein
MGAGLPAGPGGALEQMPSSDSEAVGQVKDKARELAAHVSERVGDAWESASRGARQGAHAVAESAENFWDDAIALVRRYPMASVAVAFAVGCLTPACLAACFGRGNDAARGMSRSSM